MKNHGQSAVRFSQNGVGVVEILIALVVVSFGVLGMAGLQLTGMKHSSSGYNRSKAALYAETMATRMRGNAEGVETLAYSALAMPDCTAPPVPYCQARPVGVAAETCTPAEMALFDNFAIACGDLGSDGIAANGVASELLNGQLVVACDDAPCQANSHYTITVTWNETTDPDQVNDTATKRVQIRFNP